MPSGHLSNVLGHVSSGFLNGIKKLDNLAARQIVTVWKLDLSHIKIPTAIQGSVCQGPVSSLINETNYVVLISKTQIFNSCAKLIKIPAGKLYSIKCETRIADRSKKQGDLSLALFKSDLGTNKRWDKSFFGIVVATPDTRPGCAAIVCWD